MLKLRVLWVMFGLLLGLSFFGPQAAQASHFRYGTINWEPTVNPGEIQFHVTVAYRRSAFSGTASDGLPQIGDMIFPTFFDFGDMSPVDGTTPYTVTAISTDAEDYLIASAVFIHTYTTAGPFTAGINDCCRIGTLNNRAGDNYIVSTTVLPLAGISSPITTLVPIVLVAPGSASTFTIPAISTTGDKLHFRLSTDDEAGSSTSNSSPPGLTVDPNTGVVTWNNTGLDQINPWTVQIEIEDLDVNGTVLTSIPVDFILEIVAGGGANHAPACALTSNGQALGSVVTVLPGQTLTFTLTGTDQDASDTVTLNSAGLIPDMLPSPALPVSGPSGATSTITYMPTSLDLGKHLVQFTVTDSHMVQSTCTVEFDVPNKSGAKTDLAVTTTASPLSQYMGQPLTYTDVVTNNGPDNASGVVLQETLPVGSTLLSATPAPISHNGNVYVFSLGALLAGAKQTVTLVTSATVAGAATNTVHVAGAETDLITANNDASVTTNVLPEADLVASATAAPSLVPYNDTVTYVDTVTNNGLGTATNITVKDILPAGVTLVSSVPIATKHTGNTYYFDLGAMGNGTIKTVTITATIQTAGTITNGFTAKSDVYDPDLTNNTAGAATTTLSGDLVATQFSSPASTTQGATVKFVDTVKNTGPTAVNDVVLTDTLPAGMTLASTSLVPTSHTGNVYTFHLGTLSKNDQVSIIFTATSATPGVMTNTSSVTSAAYDPDPSNNTSQSSVTIVPTSDLVTTLAATPASTIIGGTTTYVATVKNLGPSVANNVVVTDTLSSHVTPITSTPPSVTPVTPTTHAYDFKLGTLAVGASATVTIQVRADAAGPATNSATAHASETDPDLTNNGDHLSTVVDPAADLKVTQTEYPVSHPVGKTFTFVTTVVNRGPSTASNVKVIDTIPAGTAVTATSIAPESVVGNVVTFSVGSLANGAQASVTVTVVTTAAGIITNTSLASSTTADSNVANNTSTASATVTPSNDLEASAAGTPNPVLVGAHVLYTDTVVNHGATPATNVTITDTFPAGIVPVISTPGPISHTGNAYTFKLGTIPPGGSATVTIKGTAVLLGSSTNVFTVTSNEYDPTASNNTASVTNSVLPVADLLVATAVSASSVTVGTDLVYTTTILNNGPSTAPSVVFTDSLPSTVKAFISNISPVSQSGNSYSFALGDIPSGTSVTVVIHVHTVSAGSATNQVAASSSATDPTLSNNYAHGVSAVH